MKRGSWAAVLEQPGIWGDAWRVFCVFLVGVLLFVAIEWAIQHPHDAYLESTFNAVTSRQVRAFMEAVDTHVADAEIIATMMSTTFSISINESLYRNYVTFAELGEILGTPKVQPDLSDLQRSARFIFLPFVDERNRTTYENVSDAFFRMLQAEAVGSPGADDPVLPPGLSHFQFLVEASNGTEYIPCPNSSVGYYYPVLLVTPTLYQDLEVPPLFDMRSSPQYGDILDEVSLTNRIHPLFTAPGIFAGEEAMYGNKLTTRFIVESDSPSKHVTYAILTLPEVLKEAMLNEIDAMGLYTLLFHNGSVTEEEVATLNEATEQNNTVVSAKSFILSTGNVDLSDCLGMEFIQGYFQPNQSTLVNCTMEEAFEAAYSYRNVYVVDAGARKWVIVTIAGQNYLEDDGFQKILLYCFLGLVFLVTILYAYRLHLTRRDRMMLKEAEARARAKFLTYMYHELRNPLHALRNLSESLVEETESPENADSGLLIKSIVFHMCDLLSSFVVEGRSGLVLKKSLLKRGLSSQVEDGEQIGKRKIVLKGGCFPYPSKTNLGKADLSASMIQLSPCYINVEKVTRETFLEYRAMGAESVELKLVIGSEAKGLIGYYDPVRIRQILSNGLSNANKFTTSGSIELSVELLASSMLAFTITDTGIGLDSANDSNKIFESLKYGLSKSSLNEKGFQPSTGLGLGLCKILVEMMNGKISLKNRADGVRGTVFRVSLPYVGASSKTSSSLGFTNRHRGSHSQSHSPAEVASEQISPKLTYSDTPASKSAVTAVLSKDLNESLDGPANDPAGTNFDITKTNVLACEDDPVNASILKRMLMKKLGIPEAQIVILEDGDEVEGFLESERGMSFGVDILLLDIVMRRMHGDVLCEILRKKGYSFPIIATTGTCMEEDRLRFLKLGFNKVIAKPYTSTDIGAVITEECKVSNDEEMEISQILVV